MTQITTRFFHQQFCDKKIGETMNYVAAIVCVIALVTINIFGKESSDINSILSAAIMACVWGGVQRGRSSSDEKPPTPLRKKKTPESGGE